MHIFKVFPVLISLFFSAGIFPLCAQPRPRPPAPPGMNFNGHRMPPRSEFFSVIGLKIEESGDFLIISIFFNDSVDSNSVGPEHIFINDEPLPPQTEFLFNRSRNMTRFSVPRMDESFSLMFVELRSFDGKIMNPTKISGLEANSFRKFSWEERTWQKSSL